jgi:hypothetical protein
MLKAPFNHERKNDLFKSHFEIGNNEKHFKTSNKAQFHGLPPNTDKGYSNAMNLKHAHFPLGSNNKSDYVTNQMVALRWVQPKATECPKPTASSKQT